MEAIRYTKLSVFILVFIFIGQVSAFSADGHWQWINAGRLKTMMQERTGLWLVDIRSEGSYNGGHIEGAVNIGAAFVRHKKFPANKPLIIVDDSLGLLTALETAEELVKNGFVQVYVLDGGMTAWIKEGNTVAGNKPPAARGVTKKELQKALSAKVPLKLYDLRSDKEREKGSLEGSGTVKGKDAVERLESLKEILVKEDKTNTLDGLNKKGPVVLVFSASEDAAGLCEKVLHGLKDDVRYLIGGYETLAASKFSGAADKCPTCPGK